MIVYTINFLAYFMLTSSFSQACKEFTSSSTFRRKIHFISVLPPVSGGNFSFIQWAPYFVLVIPTSWPLSKLSSFCLGKSIPGCIWGQALETLRWPWSLLSNETCLSIPRLGLVLQQCSARASKQTAKPLVRRTEVAPSTDSEWMQRQQESCLSKMLYRFTCLFSDQPHLSPAFQITTKHSWLLLQGSWGLKAALVEKDRCSSGGWIFAPFGNSYPNII